MEKFDEKDELFLKKKNSGNDNKDVKRRSMRAKSNKFSDESILNYFFSNL